MASSSWHSHYLKNINLEFNDPKMKPCKKKEEFFSTQIDRVMYKAPYKYNLRISAKKIQEKKLSFSLTLSYANGEKVKEDKVYWKVTDKRNGGQRNKMLFEKLIQFKICSYKHGGRAFKITINVKDEKDLLLLIVSDPFTIKAKKPIVNPGIKSKKKTFGIITQPNKEIGRKRKRIESIQPRKRMKTGFKQTPTFPMIQMPIQSTNTFLPPYDQMGTKKMMNNFRLSLPPTTDPSMTCVPQTITGFTPKKIKTPTTYSSTVKDLATLGTLGTLGVETTMEPFDLSILNYNHFDGNLMDENKLKQQIEINDKIIGYNTSMLEKNRQLLSQKTNTYEPFDQSSWSSPNFGSSLNAYDFGTTHFEDGVEDMQQQYQFY